MNTFGEAREAEATKWLCERQEGFAPGRAAAFARWIASDPRNAVAVRRVERTIGMLELLPAVASSLEIRYGRVAPRVPGVGRTRRASMASRWRYGALAAAAVLGFGALGTLGMWRAGKLERADVHYVAQSAFPNCVPLVDGSVIDLNVGSEVRVRYSPSTRAVALAVGEAHFAVAPDSARPFEVVAAGVTIRAIGTAFNVRIVGQAVELMVTEGRVEVRCDADSGAAGRHVAAGERLIVEQDRVPHASEVKKIAVDDARRLLAWQEQPTNFTDVPLRDLVTRFNRYSGTRLVLADAALGERRLGGVFALGQIDAVVRLLEAEGEIVAEHRDADVIVLHRAR
jgi:transmembrane sensor